MLDVKVTRRFGAFELDVSLTALPGQTLVIAGESGSGKTTLLRLLAGLEHADAGAITLNGAVLFDADRRIDIPAWQRSVGYVPQDYALFPHLTVFENVAFGLEAQGSARATIAPRVTAALERLGLGELSSVRPARLSGGQQQRTALARALILEPDLLLLDEPLSALDLRTRGSVRAELRRVLKSLSCITLYVTHAPGEALLLGDDIAVLEHGRLTQVGSPEDFLQRPRSHYVAAFLGTNFIQGRVLEHGPGGLCRIGGEHASIWAFPPPGAEGELFATIDPQALAVHRERPSGDPRNLFRGTITEIVPEPPHGRRTRVTLGTSPVLVAEIAVEQVQALGLQEDEVVWATFDPALATCYQ